MRKVSPEIARCVLFSAIAFLLGACMKPVGVSSFLQDDKVQGIIIAGNSGAVINPGYENPEDLPPVLALDNGTPGGRRLDSGETVNVTLGDEVTIKVTNAAVYDDGIEWFYGENYLDDGDSYTVDTTSSPFDEEGTYQLMAKGIAKGRPYSTEIFIKVEEEE
jgi:hypothetical protein